VKVDADTSRHVSLMNHHVLEVTPQVSMIPNNVLQMRDHHLFYMKKLQFSKVDILKVQASKSGYLGFRGSCFNYQRNRCHPCFGGLSYECE
jgi:hypothetical protein